MCIPPWIIDSFLRNKRLPRDPVEAAQDLSERLDDMGFIATMHGRLRLLDLRVEDTFVDTITVITLAPDGDALRRGSHIPTVEPKAGTRFAIDLERGRIVLNAA